MLRCRRASNGVLIDVVKAGRFVVPALRVRTFPSGDMLRMTARERVLCEMDDVHLSAERGVLVGLLLLTPGQLFFLDRSKESTTHGVLQYSTDLAAISPQKSSTDETHPASHPRTSRTSHTSRTARAQHLLPTLSLSPVNFIWRLEWLVRLVQRRM